MIMSNEELIRKIKNEQNKKALGGKSYFSIFEFQEKVINGEITDDNGVAELVINGERREEYNVFIDRRCITKVGTVISFAGLLKMYGQDNIMVYCRPRTY